MDSVLYHVENVSIPMLLMVSLGLLIGLLVLPKKFGFYFSIFLMGAWLNISRFNGLAPISTAAKFTFMVPPLMMLFCSSAITGPRRSVPVIAWAYLLCPLFGLICVMGTTDKLQGVAQFSAMFFMALAAITLYRVATNNEVLTKSLAALFLGLLVPVAICLLALVLFRGQSFRAGVNRFEPFGLMSNQYVQILASASCLAACGYFTSAKTWVKTFCLAVIGACVLMLMVSGSRQGLVIMAISLLPALWNVRRNPIAVAFGAACVVAVSAYLFRYTDNLYSSHITDFSTTSKRYDIAMQYLDVVMARPVTGLMGTRGLSVETPAVNQKIPHNSYMRMAYLGGIVLVLPLAIAAISTLLSGAYVFRHRNRLKINHMVLASLAALLLAVYVQGLVNDMIYLSNSVLPFMHFFISCFFIGTAQDLKRHPAYSTQQYNMPRSMAAMG
jgi:hypothetical protein